MPYDWLQTPEGKKRHALQTVTKKTAEKESAYRVWIRAMKMAHQVGCSYESIGEHAGMSKDSVRKLIQ